MSPVLRDFKKPYRIEKKETIFKKGFFWIIILILVIFSGLFYFIVFSQVFQIKEIKISNGQGLLLQDVQNKIQNQIEQRILFFPSRSIFLVNLKQIGQIVLKQFPQIAKISLKREFPNVLRIKIEQRKPAAIFYQDQEYFLIDKKGIIFEKFFRNELEILKIKNLEQQGKLELGDVAVKQGLMTKILEIKEKLKENLEISSKQFSIISDKKIEIKTEEDWKIFFNPEHNISLQIFNLEIVLKQEISLDKRGNLEYIDLRWGNEIFYKYR